MTGQIYLIDQHDELQPLPERPYDSEDFLQGLLEKYPDLLAGEQMNEDAPRQWLLVDREYGVPDQEDGYDRWSLDHLFLDQDSVPTLVEVKRSTDTRIRREVVGQMLDYAANAVVYWPLSRIRQTFEASAEAQGEDSVHLVRRLIGSEEEGDVEAFWERVKTNLQAGRIRMVFVADQIPVELRRVVEFLNEQMDPAEVLAVEVKQFVGEHVRTLVAKVIGQTASALQKKRPSPSTGTPWTEERFMREIADRQGPESAKLAGRLLAWADEEGLRISWGSGTAHGVFYPVLDHGGTWHTFAAPWTHTGNVEIQFQYMKGPYADEPARLDLPRRLNAISGIQLDERRVSARPSFHLTALADPENMAAFLEIWRAYLDDIQAS